MYGTRNNAIPYLVSDFLTINTAEISDCVPIYTAEISDCVTYI